eukprot:CAMPEP_0197690182 /NCGR_PEP_ID=MMETSP1338-20131121/107984_1 /TAXON_ID=43686 ORGANISM="Pelagodinium beii, Strain RCC1491" /NCGR_SAMPLE_ID=MMETSP1338 /ASSEMBLY_ACC=CAM_ASM_000754 /LENGTH=939 /DNA_ID=CAMNT_0043272603 /DNA_START=116 /DNA_END=2933 /DNA_ORIENTATION=-
MGELKKTVALVSAEAEQSRQASKQASISVTDIFHMVRKRRPDWIVTPHRVRKALQSLQNSKNGGKQGGSVTSPESFDRVFPQDVVEYRPNSKSKLSEIQWRGQVLRVAGYDDGEASEDEQELPSGFCSVFWLGHNLEQWPNALTKESSLRVIDRPWVLGDRVAKIEDPRSLGFVVRVNCRLKIAQAMQSLSREAPMQQVRPVGGFTAEDWVASESSRWIGKIDEAVFRVEVELCGKRTALRGRGRSKAPACVFQVSSEGLAGLEPAGQEDATPSELSPHFPGQRVRAPARLWRQAEWIRGGLGKRSPRRGDNICGVVKAVKCDLLAVRWLAGMFKDSQPPDEWVNPDSVCLLTLPNSEGWGWAIGDHVQSPESPLSARIVESHSLVNVRWADGSVEECVPSTRLCPRPHVSAHDFLPNDFVARSAEGFGDAGQLQDISISPPGQVMQETNPLDGFYAMQIYDHFSHSGAETNDSPMYDAISEAEILPSPDVLGSQEVSASLGVITGVDLQARTAKVQWSSEDEPEEVSVFELTEHPQVDVRLTDAVLIAESQDDAWAGRVCSLKDSGQALVKLLHGGCEWIDVRNLIVVDDDIEGPQTPEAASTSPDSVASEATDDDSIQEERSVEAEGCNAESAVPVAGVEVDMDLHTDATDLKAGRKVQSSGEGGESSVSEILAFDVCDEDVDAAEHFFRQQPSLGTRALMLAVRREMAVLKEGLLEGKEGVPAPIVVRTFASRSDLFRVMVVGPPDTPYEHVPFFFDLALSAEYPREPPLAHFHSHYVGSERLNPNLYADGKVCLSLLGTWSGPAWDPQQSTLLQVLVSLQGLVLVEEPYFNEPGHECDAGTEHGREASALYNENARLLALRAALNAAQRPPRGFEEITAAHFARFGPKLAEQCEEALKEPKASQNSDGFRQVLAKQFFPGFVSGGLQQRAEHAQD